MFSAASLAVVCEVAMTMAMSLFWCCVLFFVRGRWVGFLMFLVTGYVIGRELVYSSARSCFEYVVTMFLVVSVFDRSTPPIRVWVNGFRTTIMWSMLGTDRSSVYFPWPVISLASSFRKTEIPTMRCSITAIN